MEQRNSTFDRRVRRLGSTIGAAALIVGITAAALSTTAAAAATRTRAVTTTTASPAAGHSYRHGVVPSLTWLRAHPNANAIEPAAANLTYGGGISGVGVTTGAPKIYLVFWGSQWGTQGTNGAGNITLSGDPDSMAPDLEAFFKGLGTGGELWSGVMTQYCQGVAVGTATCPASAAHVGYPTGGAFAGVWADESGAAPGAATGHQIGQEAVNAATHFGNTTSASNRNTQYDIVSPTGVDPDDYEQQGFCAWHDYTGDTSLDGGGAVTSPDGLLAFTNMPYVPDAGSSCGAGFVNPGNNLDGVTIVNGHEYAETITDQYPAGGWTDSSGEEDGDKCAWVTTGVGASRDLSLTTGSFAVQTTWGNDTNNCQFSHAIVGGTNTVTVTNPGSQTSTVGTAVSLAITATDSGGATLTYSASGLPAGLSINSSTGVISGTPTTSGVYSTTVTATDTTSATGNAAFSWTVDAGPSITLQPLSVTVTSGQVATFTAAASGLPAPTVQWQFSTNGGATWQTDPGATSTTLSGSVTTFEQGWEFEAVFTNSVSSVITSAATLTVDTPPSVTKNPLSETVSSGQVATFTAAASGLPAPTVQWQFSTSEGPIVWQNDPGATSTTLSGTVTGFENGWLFRAVFTNSLGSSTTGAAILTVH